MSTEREDQLTDVTTKKSRGKKKEQPTPGAGAAPKEQVIEAEVIPDAPGAAPVKVVVINEDEIVGSQLSKIDFNMQQLKAWEEEYAKIEVTSLEDVDAIAKLKEGKKTIRTARTSLEDKRTELKAPFISMGKKIDAKAGEYSIVIKAIEGPIDTKLALVAQWEQDKKDKEEAEKTRLRDWRVDELKTAGMVFNGAYYVIGENISMDIATIAGMKDGDFQALYVKVGLEKKKIEQAEAERIALEEAANEERRLAQEKIDLANKEIEDKRKEQEEQTKKLEEEKAAMRRDMLQMREEQAAGIGLIFNPGTMSYSFKNKYAEVSITKQDMETMERVDYNKFLTDNKFIITTAVQNQTAADAIAQQKTDRINARKNELQLLGLLATGEGNYHIPLSEPMIAVRKAEIEDGTPEGWQATVNQLRTNINTWNEVLQSRALHQKEQEEKEKNMFISRSNDLVKLGYISMDGGAYFEYENKYEQCVQVGRGHIMEVPDNLWPAELVERKAAIERLKQAEAAKDKELEEIRQKALGDAGKMIEYYNAIKAIPLPTVEGEDFKVVLGAYRDALADMLTETNKLV